MKVLPQFSNQNFQTTKVFILGSWWLLFGNNHFFEKAVYTDNHHPSPSWSSSCCGRQLKWQTCSLSIHHPDTRKEELLKLKDNVCIRAARPQINSCWKSGEGFNQSSRFLEWSDGVGGEYPFLRRGGRWVSSWSITHDGADFDLIESERSNFIFLLHARGLWAARALPNDPCYMERNLKNVRYWISIVFPSPFAFKTSFQMLCVGQDTFLLNTHPIFPIADSGWRRRLL